MKRDPGLISLSTLLLITIPQILFLAQAGAAADPGVYGPYNGIFISSGLGLEESSISRSALSLHCAVVDLLLGAHR